MTINEDELKRLGDRLRQARLRKYGPARGSAKKCAADMDLSPQAWSGYEAGRTEIGFTKIISFARFFGVDPTWLLSGEGSINPSSRPAGESGYGLPEHIIDLLVRAKEFRMLIEDFELALVRGEISGTAFSTYLEKCVDLMKEIEPFLPGREEKRIG